MTDRKRVGSPSSSASSSSSFAIPPQDNMGLKSVQDFIGQTQAPVAQANVNNPGLASFSMPKDVYKPAQVSTPVMPQAQQSTQAPATQPPAQTAQATNLEIQKGELQTAIESAEKTPELTYEQRLQKHNLSKKDAMDMIAEMLGNNCVKRTYTVVGNVTVTFISRSGEQNAQLLEYIEKKNPAWGITTADIASRYNLATSLLNYANHDFTTTSFDDKLAYVNKLSTYIIYLLVTKLSKFDAMLDTVFNEGALENFS